MAENFIVESPEDEIVAKISRQGFTYVTFSLREFLTSKGFSGCVCALFVNQSINQSIIFIGPQMSFI